MSAARKQSSTLIAILAAVIVYIVMLSITGLLRKYVMEYIPAAAADEADEQARFWRQ